MASGKDILRYPLKNVTLVDMYYGGDLEVLERREQIKQKAMFLRMKQNHTLKLTEKAGEVYMSPKTPLLVFDPICPNPLEDVHKYNKPQY
jgi:hypothetical protein